VPVTVVNALRAEAVACAGVSFGVVPTEMVACEAASVVSTLPAASVETTASPPTTCRPW
jgi:hypothetical protein